MQIPRLPTEKINFSPPSKSQQLPKTARSYFNPNAIFKKQKKSQLFSPAECRDQETLIQEKNDLVNEIRYLEAQLQLKKSEIKTLNQEIVHNKESDIQFQQRFSNKSVSDAAKRRYEAETLHSKLQELFEKTEENFQNVWKIFSPEQEYKLKFDVTVQRQELKLRTHEISELDRKQKEIDEELNSFELQSRIGEMDDLTKQYDSLREVYKQEKQRQQDLINTLRNTKPLAKVPRSEMEAEVARLSHKLNNMNKVSAVYERKQNQTGNTIVIAPTLPTSPRRKNPRVVKPKKEAPPPEPIKEEESNDFTESNDDSLQEKPQIENKVEKHEEEEEKDVFDTDSETKKNEEEEQFEDFEPEEKEDNKEKKEEEEEQFEDFEADGKDDDKEKKEEEEEEKNDDDDDFEDDFEDNLFNITQNRKFER